MTLQKEEIIKNIKRSALSSTVGAILILIFAIVLLRNPENFLSVAITIFGYGAIIMGALNMVLFFRLPKEQRILQNRLTNGILLISFGFIAFFENVLLKDIATFLLGFYLLYVNAKRVELAMNIRDYTLKLWIVILVMAIINVLLSFFMIMNPFTTKISVNIYLASLMISCEVSYVIQNGLLYFGLSKKKKDQEKGNEIVINK